MIPPGHVWLSGDNPKNSLDSRTYDPVPMALLQKKVLFRLSPHPFWFVQAVDRKPPDSLNIEIREEQDGKLLPKSRSDEVTPPADENTRDSGIRSIQSTELEGKGEKS